MMTNRTVQQVLKAADPDTTEHDYIIDCLKSAVSYCKQQFEDSGIDWLPTVSFVGLQNEADKFVLLDLYLKEFVFD